MIKIVEANPNHIPIIQALATEIWPITFDKILSQDQISYMMEMMYSDKALTDQMTSHGHRFLLAQEDDCPVGYLSFEINYKSDRKTKIHKIYLLPKTQGRGLGKKLFNQVKQIALQHDNHTLSLNVNRDNTAVHFYKKIGFEIVGEQDIAIGDGFLMEDFIMEQPI
ncbi:GNAT family N-acetyltransferase [Sphingobacterium faecale]|uniref:GNAT family N-acetyltransferase n=1 Tax=Sphingobacterium faecale TaxID=2803775 RepID=A0ABS1R6G3_9SPHI|nr:GNAT family N-acetyltransferase [Sphingobacterium faecale]MBL1410301.1 GNAT family N-acetyltransferase [Sphingobacterium faecale]